MSATNCIRALSQAAGRALTNDEVQAIYEKVHQAALDIKAGRASPADVELGQGKKTTQLRADLSAQGATMDANTLIQAAAARAARELEHEAIIRERNANLQMAALARRYADYDTLRAGGFKHLDAIDRMIARDYTGRAKNESIEQRAAGLTAEFKRRLDSTWKALGDDFLGFFQDREKVLALVRELRSEPTGDPLAAKGAKAFHEVAEEARSAFNAAGGDVGRLDDWGHPQHHSQDKVSRAAEILGSPATADPQANRQAWVDYMVPKLLGHPRYVDDLGRPWGEPELRAMLEHAWQSIATNGHANVVPGKFTGAGSRASRNAEHRQIHFKTADDVIEYWEKFGERTVLEILIDHTDSMAKDIAFIESFGPSPDMTYKTLRARALKEATIANPQKTEQLQGRAVALDNLYRYAAGATLPTYRPWLKATMDGISNLNTAAKLGGAMWASLFGDKPMMEAVAHLNHLPAWERWKTELSLFNPANAADRRQLEQQGLMLDGIRSGLQRFYEGLGKSSFTGKLANAVMRVTGMQAVNDLRKGAFGLQMMAAVGRELKDGRAFDTLPDTDVRALRQYGITRTDWEIWKLAPLDTLAKVDDVLTPEAISRIPDDVLKQHNLIAQADTGPEAAARRRDAIVKLLGIVNTESEFAVVTPGWRERSQFYGTSQRGTVQGEFTRAVLQFKSFPWAMFQRGMDAIANMDGPASKAAMASWLMVSTTLAGAMIMQVREMLSGKDPRAMADRDWYKFWGQAFLQGGALGIYGDFLYGVNETRYGSGPLEAAAGPTIGPLLELGLVIPLTAAKRAIEGKDTHLGAQMISRAKGFFPGNNIWYTKAATEHLFWHQVMDAVSPGYLSNMRKKTTKDYNQDWWWQPGEMAPDRPPNMREAIR